MTQEKIFRELDHLIGNDMLVLNFGLNDITEFLERNNIPLDTKVRQPIVGEDPESIEDIGAVLMRMALSIKDFLSEYREIKDTWCVTAPSSVLNDEK